MEAEYSLDYQYNSEISRQIVSYIGVMFAYSKI
jgi:hypothetical protein